MDRHRIPEWNVQLAISGPVAVKERLELDVQKGMDHPFWTRVKLINKQPGVQAEVVARATTIEEANDAAVYFVGQMLDVLCLWLDLPLHLSLSGPDFRPLPGHVKRLVEKDEWERAFRRGREYGLQWPAYSRALSWYRKGLVSEDPIDKLLAFWNSLEVLGSKHARKTERTEKGAINQVCDCFDQIWKSVGSWRVIPDEAERVNAFYELRIGVAHGARRVDVETIREIALQLPKLKELAHAFLSDWEHYRESDTEGSLR